MLLKIDFLPREAVVVKPQERFGKVDGFSLFDAPSNGLELFEPWT